MTNPRCQAPPGSNKQLAYQTFFDRTGFRHAAQPGRGFQELIINEITELKGRSRLVPFVYFAQKVVALG